jgi:hypothetical protein
MRSESAGIRLNGKAPTADGPCDPARTRNAADRPNPPLPPADRWQTGSKPATRPQTGPKTDAETDLKTGCQHERQPGFTSKSGANSRA